MRHVTFCLVVLALGFTLAHAAPQKLEKKLVSKAIEQEYQKKLDATSELADVALQEAADDETIDRTKKQVSTFCVHLHKDPNQNINNYNGNGGYSYQPSQEQQQQQQQIPMPQQFSEQQPGQPGQSAQLNIEIPVPAGPQTLYQVPSMYGPNSMIPGFSGPGGTPISVLHMPGAGIPGFSGPGGAPISVLHMPGSGIPGFSGLGGAPISVLHMPGATSMPSNLMSYGGPGYPFLHLTSGFTPAAGIPFLPGGRPQTPGVHIIPGLSGYSPSVHHLHTPGGYGGLLPSSDPLNKVICNCKGVTPNNRYMTANFLFEHPRNGYPYSPLKPK